MVSTPLKNLTWPVTQLGWWNSQLFMGKCISCSKLPTSIISVLERISRLKLCPSVPSSVANRSAMAKVLNVLSLSSVAATAVNKQSQSRSSQRRLRIESNDSIYRTQQHSTTQTQYAQDWHTLTIDFVTKCFTSQAFVPLSNLHPECSTLFHVVPKISDLCENLDGFTILSPLITINYHIITILSPYQNCFGGKSEQWSQQRGSACLHLRWIEGIPWTNLRLCHTGTSKKSWRFSLIVPKKIS